MKKIVSVFLALVIFISTLTGCNQKVPEGINKEFYKDMVKCLELTEKALKYKNQKYVKQIGNLIVKNTSDNFFKVLWGLEEIDDKAENNYGLNEKEQEILSKVVSVHMYLGMYIDLSLTNSGIDANKMIDLNSITGKTLYKSIQDLITAMEIDYDIKIYSN